LETTVLSIKERFESRVDVVGPLRPSAAAVFRRAFGRSIRLRWPRFPTRVVYRPDEAW